MSNEWLKEAEASSEVIQILSSSTTIPCIINRTALDSHYDPTIGVSIMSKSLANALLGEEPLAPTHKFLKLPSRQLVESYGITHTIPTTINKINVLLNFFIFDIGEFNLLFGHPLMKLLDGYCEGSLKGHLGKNVSLSIPLTNSTNSKTESNPEPDPMK